jgi:hypothetical protein
VTPTGRATVKDDGAGRAALFDVDGTLSTPTVCTP